MRQQLTCYQNAKFMDLLGFLARCPPPRGPYVLLTPPMASSLRFRDSSKHRSNEHWRVIEQRCTCHALRTVKSQDHILFIRGRRRSSSCAIFTSSSICPSRSVASTSSTELHARHTCNLSEYTFSKVRRYTASCGKLCTASRIRWLAAINSSLPLSITSSPTTPVVVFERAAAGGGAAEVVPERTRFIDPNEDTCCSMKLSVSRTSARCGPPRSIGAMACAASAATSTNGRVQPLGRTSGRKQCVRAVSAVEVPSSYTKVRPQAFCSKPSRRLPFHSFPS